ncbi:SxtJ family membrane protein [Mesorhizobium sp. 10J20-29]
MKTTALPSNRKFGALIGGVLALVALRGHFLEWSVATIAPVSLLAFVFVGIAIIAPNSLSPLTAAWMKFGLLLGKIVGPIVLGSLFFLVITPVAVVTRLFGRDELRLRRPGANSYWIVREPPGPAGDTFKNQF